MDWLIAPTLALSLAATLCVLALLARRVRRRGSAGPAIAAAMAAYDEAFHTTAHSAFVEVRAQDERPAQASSPGKRRR